MSIPTQQLKTFDLIDRMRLLLSNSRAIPLTGKVAVDRDELDSLFEKLEKSIPNDLQQAREVLKVSEQMIEDSKKQAEETVNLANQQAQDTVNKANNQAASTVNQANASAVEIGRAASEQANAMIADAQARVQTMIADAQAQANLLVSESEIIARAQAEAQEMMDNTQRECEEYSMRIHGAVAQMVEQTDMAMAQQLDALRTLRQEISMSREM